MKLRSELGRHFVEDTAFDRLIALDGEIYRDMPARRTLRFAVGGRSYFIKVHFGVGWREILKNLLCFKLPVLGARDEWRAIRRLNELEVQSMTVAGYGERGWNPARRQSFLVTEALEEMISLEELAQAWLQNPPPPALDRSVIEKVAHIARTLHENGVNHRDFYTCHFLLDPRTLESHKPRDAAPGRRHVRMHLIDLHRAHVRRRTPRRWIVKDVSGLFFSCMDIGLTRTDLLRFMRVYRGRSLRSTLIDDARFWKRVAKSGLALYRKVHGRLPHPSIVALAEAVETGNPARGRRTSPTIDSPTIARRAA
ncbi:MAG: lipopolysaccharide core heptose(I) kinase RfaP [Planctomycetaceae bacterium]